MILILELNRTLKKIEVMSFLSKRFSDYISNTANHINLYENGDGRSLSTPL